MLKIENLHKVRLRYEYMRGKKFSPMSLMEKEIE